MSDRLDDIPPQAVQEARLNPGGWVYQIEGEFGPDDEVPPEAIIGGWKVDDEGNIVGKFIPNPNYLEKAKRGQAE